MVKEIFAPGSVIKPDAKARKGRKTFGCTYCSNVSTTEGRRRNHEDICDKNPAIFRNEDGKIPCTYAGCHKTFDHKKQLKIHVNAIHLKSRPVKPTF